MKSQIVKMASERLRYTIQRLTFHNHIASSVAAELRYRFLRPDSEREAIMQSIISDYLTSRIVPDGRDMKAVVKEILYARAYYAIENKEYFLFGLNHDKNKDLRDYVGWYEQKCYFEQLNKIGAPDCFIYKERTNERFQEFYKRKLIYVASEQDKQAFIDFFMRQKPGIIKPTDSYGGHDVQIISVSGCESSEQLWENVHNRTPFVLEELIDQAPEMNAFYPKAVNTIRYNTFFHDSKLKRLQAVLRMGQGGSIVDNATSGGIYALVDTQTGRILGPARSDWLEYFERHPDTGTQLTGSYIPQWNELNELIEKVVRIVPEQKQVGWDFALSKDGWVMVEGNTFPALQSFDLDHGLRGLLHETFGQVLQLWA